MMGKLLLEKIYHLNQLKKWAQEARYFEPYLAIRLVCSPDTRALDLQVGKLKFPPPISVPNATTCRRFVESGRTLSPGPGSQDMHDTLRSDNPSPRGLCQFQGMRSRCPGRSARDLSKGGLVGRRDHELVIDERYAREEAAREARKEQYQHEMDDLKAVFSMCSFLRALVPQERVWEEIDIF